MFLKIGDMKFQEKKFGMSQKLQKKNKKIKHKVLRVLLSEGSKQ